MPPRKSLDGKSSAVATRSSPIPTSKLPSFLRFPLLAITSLSLSSLIYTLAGQYFAGDLGKASRSLTDSREVVALLAFRTVELGVGWYGDYDGIDLAALTLLSHLPPLYLLSSFYSISPISAGISLVIDISTTYLPFRLLRPLSTIHTPSSSPTRTIIDDMTVRLWTTLLATSIYGSIFYISYRTFLPSFLITHFEGLVTLSTAYETSLPILLASMVPVGYAVREFIFSPSTAAAAAAESAASGKSSASSPAFNPVTATLGETVLHNVWGYNRHTKVTLQRTATLVGLVLGNTWLQGTLTVAGIDPVGAAGWAGLWAGAGLASGAVFWWVGNV